MRISATTRDAQQLMHQGVQCLSAATRQGMRVDVGYIQKQMKHLDLKCEMLTDEFAETPLGRKWRKTFISTNWNSDDQLRDILYIKEGLIPIKLTKPSKRFPDGQPSVDNDTLDLISKTHPDIIPFMDYKKMKKVKDTFLAGILREQVDGILHPFFHLHKVKTFRSSSSNVNFHNQPNRDKMQKKIVRQSFLPRKGYHFMACDFSGIEVAISCCYHKDIKMLEYVRHPEKNNMHTDMAVQLYMLDKFIKDGAEKTLRKGSKNGFVFPQFYGDYFVNNAASLATWGELPTSGTFNPEDGRLLCTGLNLGEHLIKKGCPDYESFLNHVQAVEADFWNNRFKGYRDWKKRNVNAYMRKGFLNTLTGFTCSGEMGPNDINNYPIQGSAFHSLLKTYIETFHRMNAKGFQSKLIGQIHDELVVDTHPDETYDVLMIMKEIATQWLHKQWKWIIVPLVLEANIFDVDANWASGSRTIELSEHNTREIKMAA